MVKKLLVTAAAAVAFMFGVQAALADNAWFRADIPAFPNSGDQTVNGTWCSDAASIAEYDAVSEAVVLTDSSKTLSFTTADAGRDPSVYNLEVTSEMSFTPYDSNDLPEVPAEAKVAIITVADGTETNYYGLAKDTNGSNTWVRLYGATPSLSPVEVKITLFNGGESICANYKVGDTTLTLDGDDQVDVPIACEGFVTSANYRGVGSVKSLYAYANATSGQLTIAAEDLLTYGLQVTNVTLNGESVTETAGVYPIPNGDNQTVVIYFAAAGNKVLVGDGTLTINNYSGDVIIDSSSDGLPKLVDATAQIGTANYATIVEAYAAAKTGDTIKLLANQNLAAPLTNEVAVCLDLNGFNVTGGLAETAGLMVTDMSGKTTVGSVDTITADYGVIVSNVTVATLNVNASAQGAQICADTAVDTINTKALVVVDGGAVTTTIASDGGSLTVNNSASVVAKVEGTFSTINISFGSVTALDITSGTVTISGGSIGSIAVGAGTVTVSGGEFNDPVPAEWCAAGKVPTQFGNGKYGVTWGYKITYSTEHGTAPAATNVTVSAEGEAFTLTAELLPVLPNVDEWTFIGWGKSVGDTITANTTLVARWTDEDVPASAEVSIAVSTPGLDFKTNDVTCTVSQLNWGSTGATTATLTLKVKDVYTGTIVATKTVEVTGNGDYVVGIDNLTPGKAYGYESVITVNDQGDPVATGDGGPAVMARATENWIDEDASTFAGTSESTGVWTNKEGASVVDNKIKIDASDAPVTFTPAAATGSIYRITMNAAFEEASVIDELETDVKGGIVIVDDAGVKKFAVFNGSAWTTVDTLVFAPELNTEYALQMVFDKGAGRLTYLLVGTDAETVLASFATTVADPVQIDFQGSGTLSSLVGQYYDANVATADGVEYATVAEALAAGKGAVTLLWDATWVVPADIAYGTYTVLNGGKKLVIDDSALKGKNLVDNGDGTYTIASSIFEAAIADDKYPTIADALNAAATSATADDPVTVTIITNELAAIETLTIPANVVLDPTKKFEEYLKYTSLVNNGTLVVYSADPLMAAMEIDGNYLVGADIGADDGDTKFFASTLVTVAEDGVTVDATDAENTEFDLGRDLEGESLTVISDILVFHGSLGANATLTLNYVSDSRDPGELTVTLADPTATFITDYDLGEEAEHVVLVDEDLEDSYEVDCAENEGLYTYTLKAKEPTTDTWTVNFTTNTVQVASLSGVKDGTAIKADDIPEIFGTFKGTWDVNPTNAVITCDTNFNFTVEAEEITYPTYIPADNQDLKDKFDTWATDVAGGDRDVGSVNLDAFLLNCKPADVTTEAAKFKIISIAKVGDKWVSKVTGEKGEGAEYGNGYVHFISVKATKFATAGEGSDFFQATLTLQPAND